MSHLRLQHRRYKCTLHETDPNSAVQAKRIELGGRRVDVYLDDDEVLRRRPGHALEDLEERLGGVRALWALRLRANRP